MTDTRLTSTEEPNGAAPAPTFRDMMLALEEETDRENREAGHEVDEDIYD